MAKKKVKLNNTLFCLTTAALALFGQNKETSALTNESTSASYRSSSYSEDKTADTERYDIVINQFRIFSPIGNNFSFALDVIVEKMSGASPWYVRPDANGIPIQIMSGATIEENRTDIKASGSVKYNNSAYSVAIGKSSENDYDSSYLGVNGEYDTRGKQTTLFAGIAASEDDITPTDAMLFKRVVRADKASKSVNIGVTQAINKRFLLSTSIGYMKLEGFLSDPYKLARTLDGTGTEKLVSDSRPRIKNQWAWTTKARYHFGNDYTLHLDYRLYEDDWDIKSHTITTSLYKTIDDKWQLIPEFRYYSQSRAYFYAPYYNGTRADGFHSSDYRLSPYGAISARLKITYKNGSAKYNFSVEKYQSSGKLSLKEVTIENPGLVNFFVVTFGYDYEF